MTDLKAIARSLFQAAVDCADPARALRNAMQVSALPACHAHGHTYIIAVGKAAVPMMREALGQIEEPRTALAVTNHENYCEIEGATVLVGGHPVPDENSAIAGRKVIELLQSATVLDRVVVLVSGGGSALLVSPVEGVSLEEKATLSQQLLASGLGINDMNLVRQKLSTLKGGGFLRHAKHAKICAYILSDVIGDDLRAIASGPTVGAIGSNNDARKLLLDAGLWSDVPLAIQKHLSSIEPAPQESTAENTLVGSNRHSLNAMLAALPKEFMGRIESDHLTGDVEQAAETIVAAAECAPKNHPIALIFGGETTVQIRGTGRGGRNQELALRVAELAEKRLCPGWVFLSGGTDGRDGPTDAAGGITCADTLLQIRSTGASPSELLANNDSYQALRLGNALLMTGGTGTNVADVQVFLRQ